MQDESYALETTSDDAFAVNGAGHPLGNEYIVSHKNQ